MTDYTNVSARALLVGLHISTWSARKYDKKVSDQVAEDHRAEKDAGRYNKHLLAGVGAHEAVIKAASKGRDVHYANTLPWTDEGTRLLPTANYITYMDAMRAVRREFDTALAIFLDEYPELRREAPTKLGRLYRASDFPDLSRVRGRFGWSIDVSPVPRCDVRLELPADQIDLIEQEVTDRVASATKSAMRDAWTRLHEAVARIQRASSDGGIVRGNLIDHAREVCEILARLNVSQDESLEALRLRVERELTDIAPEDLRNDKKLRTDTAKRAADIMSAMSEFYTPATEEETAA